ncbi:hypothetical protein FMEAI12_3550002 [Parafrankia sp. Ea1.12]|nr:hypothetical protein FMEAI12_3550002 [Parafrankia sp. Ea1.12]
MVADISHEGLRVLPREEGVSFNQARIAIVCDNCSPHLSTRVDSRVGDWVAASNVEIAYTPPAIAGSTA